MGKFLSAGGESQRSDLGSYRLSPYEFSAQRPRVLKDRQVSDMTFQRGCSSEFHPIKEARENSWGIEAKTYADCSWCLSIHYSISVPFEELFCQSPWLQAQIRPYDRREQTYCWGRVPWRSILPARAPISRVKFQRKHNKQPLSRKKSRRKLDCS